MYAQLILSPHAVRWVKVWLTDGFPSSHPAQTDRGRSLWPTVFTPSTNTAPCKCLLMALYLKQLLSALWNKPLWLIRRTQDLPLPFSCMRRSQPFQTWPKPTGDVTPPGIPLINAPSSKPAEQFPSECSNLYRGLMLSSIHPLHKENLCQLL